MPFYTETYPATAVAVNIDWEPSTTVLVESIHFNLNAADASGDPCSMKVVDADGDTIFDFESITFSNSPTATDFTVTPDNPVVIVLGNKLTIDWANSGTKTIKVSISGRSFVSGQVPQI